LPTKIFSTLLFLLPIVFLNIKHGTNLILFILFFGAITFLAKISILTTFKKSITKTQILFLFIFVSPTLAIAISQSIRNEFYINNWDAPIRMLLCIPIYLAISTGWLVSKEKESITEVWIKWAIPIALYVTFITRVYFPATNWHGYSTTYFVDPLSFCSFTLLFTFLACLGAVHYFKEVNYLHKLFYVFSIYIGFYLSITSGARTGWINLPIFIVILYFYSLIVISKKERLIFFLATLFGLAILLYNNSQFINKIYLGIQEFSNYKMNELNVDSSIEMRLSMYRMGAEYFFERPFAGWGDLSWRDSTIWREFTIFASSMAINAPKHGFHNEIITNSVRSGIWGFISVVSLYIVVAYSAASGLKMKLDRLHRLVSVSMLVVILHLFFAGLVTETTNLTFLSAFIGVLLAVLCGEQQFLEANSGN
jgi:O-antigen ligase